jgi:hypothetical protein
LPLFPYGANLPVVDRRHLRGEKMREKGKGERYAMGDKGKKDKDKGRKQKINKQEQKAKEKIAKQPRRTP